MRAPTLHACSPLSRALAAAGALMLGFALPAAAHAAPDGAFLQDAIAGDNGEIVLGRLAQARAADPRVRQFGAMLVRDHQAAKRQVIAISRHTHTRIDARAVNRDAQHAQRELGGTRGPEFDRMFVHHMVEDHQRDIAKFEHQASAGEPVTARLANETLPHLRHHLDVARSLQH